MKLKITIGKHKVEKGVSLATVRRNPGIYIPDSSGKQYPEYRAISTKNGFLFFVCTDGRFGNVDWHDYTFYKTDETLEIKIS